MLDLADVEMVAVVDRQAMAFIFSRMAQCVIKTHTRPLLYNMVLSATDAGLWYIVSVGAMMK